MIHETMRRGRVFLWGFNTIDERMGREKLVKKGNRSTGGRKA